jgi:hypothetical protein
MDDTERPSLSLHIRCQIGFTINPFPGVSCIFRHKLLSRFRLGSQIDFHQALEEKLF